MAVLTGAKQDCVGGAADSPSRSALVRGIPDSSILGMFPKNVSEFGYADLSAARELPWFPQFEAQVVPVSLYGFEQFLEAAQMQQSPVIEGVAWARIRAIQCQFPGHCCRQNPAAGKSLVLRKDTLISWQSNPF